MEKVLIEKIKLDPNLQPRNELNADAIQQYAEDMKNGDIFPPVEIKNVNGIFYLTSGWHRTLAAKRADLKEIDAIITDGTLDDAIWDACKANVEHDKSGSRRTNSDKQKAVKMALRLPRFRNGMMNYSEIARHIGVDRQTIKNWAERLGISENGNNVRTSHIVQSFTIDPTPEREPTFFEQLEERRKEVFWKEQEIQEIKQEIKTENKVQLNKVNENIEWAAWSWNPVTGCLHNCPYCYARDIANRFYPEKFQPSFHPDRLEAPDNTNVPIAPRFFGDIGYKNVFTCSMADLFGKWVPVEWIEAVLETIRRNPQWTFLLLSKFPVRMAEFDYPANVWLGTSVDYQYAVERAEKAFTRIKASGFAGVCWLSCEPMMERLTFTSLDMFDWVAMGGASRSTQTPEYRPPFDDIVHLYNQARNAGCKIYQKTNLIPGMDNSQRIREYPE